MIKKEEFEKKFCFHDNENEHHDIFLTVRPGAVWSWIENEIRQAEENLEQIIIKTPKEILQGKEAFKYLVTMPAWITEDIISAMIEYALEQAKENQLEKEK
jgi:hypothetical protein